MNDAVKGKPVSVGSSKQSQSIKSLVKMLEKLDKMLDDTPPVLQPQRFGNQAFRTWYNNLKEVLILFNSIFISVTTVIFTILASI